MLYEWLVEHHSIEQKYWWFVNKRRILRALLAKYRPNRGRLLEVGCGGGAFSVAMNQDGWRVLSSDLFFEAARYAHKNGVPEALAFSGDAGWPLADASMDAIVSADVFEHLADDRAAFREAFRILKPGGYAFITVPAYQCLYSAWDDYNKHYRRYTVGGLVAKAREAGFQVAYKSYWNAASVPPAILLRWKDRLTGKQLSGEVHFPEVSPWLNRCLVAYGYLESAWLRWMPIPFGLSVVLVIHKEKEG